MPKVKFTRDFRGRNTAEVFYQAGQVVDLPNGLVAGLLAEGAAVLIDVPAPPPVSAPAKPPAGDAPAADAPKAKKPRASKKAAKPSNGD